MSMFKLGYSILLERVEEPLIDSNDSVYNFDKWVNGETKMLYVMGIGGSGKTYMSNKLAKKYNAKVIELDMVFLELRKRYGSDKIGFRRNPEFTSEKFIEYLEREAKKNKRLIVEGVHLRAIDMDYLKDGAFIIKHTDINIATDRAVERQNDASRQANFGELRTREEWFEINKAGMERLVDFEDSVKSALY